MSDTSLAAIAWIVRGVEPDIRLGADTRGE